MHQIFWNSKWLEEAWPSIVRHQTGQPGIYETWDLGYGVAMEKRGPNEDEGTLLITTG